MRSVDLKVHLDPDGTPRGATARERLDVSVDRLWEIIVDVDYGTVVQAIDVIRKQDIERVGLVADKKKGGGETPAAQ